MAPVDVRSCYASTADVFREIHERHAVEIEALRDELRRVQGENVSLRNELARMRRRKRRGER